MTISLPPARAAYVINYEGERRETSAVSEAAPRRVDEPDLVGEHDLVNEHDSGAERQVARSPKAEPLTIIKLGTARQQIFNLQYLPDGWDGYDALAPSAATVDRALRWLVSSYTECQDAGVIWTAPRVTATAEGEVALKWYAGSWSLSVYALSEPDGEGYLESHKHHPALGKGGSASDVGGDANSAAAQIALMRWLQNPS